MKWPYADPFILPAVALLSGLGLIMTLRLAPDLAIARADTLNVVLNINPGANVTDNVLTLARIGVRHFYHIALGALLFVIVLYAFSGRLFSALSSKKYLWVLISAGLILLTLALGDRINGRRLWLFGFQTVELVKLLTLLFAAGYLYEQGTGIALYREGGGRLWLRYAGPFAAMGFFALLPLFIQKDLGPTVLICMVFFLLLFAAGNRVSVSLLFIVLMALAGYVSYQTGYPSILRERFDALFNPFGTSEAMTRVLWSLAAGGRLGVGIGYGQPYKMPEVQSDFSFAAICEEMGFVGAGTVILAYVLLTWRCFHVACSQENRYKRILVIGIACMIAIQAAIIILGNLVVIPLTGITLPFISYGGSSLIITFIMAGIVLRISGERQGATHG
jgi:cell division protein FtsW (lipid II flippase)